MPPLLAVHCRDGGQPLRPVRVSVAMIVSRPPARRIVGLECSLMFRAPVRQQLQDLSVAPRHFRDTGGGGGGGDAGRPRGRATISIFTLDQHKKACIPTILDGVGPPGLDWTLHHRGREMTSIFAVSRRRSKGEGDCQPALLQARRRPGAHRPRSPSGARGAEHSRVPWLDSGWRRMAAQGREDEDGRVARGAAGMAPE